MQKAHLTLMSTLTAGLLYAGTAGAQQKFPDDGRIVIGAERLTGVFIEKFSVTSTGTTTVGGVTASTESETDNSTTSFALLGQSSGLNFSGDATSAGGPSLTPRLGLDVFVASGFSIGGAIMYTTASGTTEGTDTTTVAGMPAMVVRDPEEDQPTSNLLVLHPRVGYGYALSPSFAIWPRLGFAYARYGVNVDPPDPMDPETDITISIMDVTVEGLLAVTPVPNVAILFGPFVDIGVGGSVDIEQSPPDPTPSTTETDVNYTTFGLTAGIGLVF